MDILLPVIMVAPMLTVLYRYTHQDTSPDLRTVLTMFVTDPMNNVRRLCSVRGLPGYRQWQVKSRVAGGRYLVKNLETGEHRVVTIESMTSLY